MFSGVVDLEAIFSINIVYKFHDCVPRAVIVLVLTKMKSREMTVKENLSLESFPSREVVVFS